MPRRTNRMKRSIKSIREYECVCAAAAPVCNDTFFVYGWRLIFSVFFLFLYFMVFCCRFHCDIGEEKKSKWNATHGKNMWFHFPWCIVNILQMKRYGLAHTWYKKWHTHTVGKGERERNVVHLCSCSYQLRWKFIVICDPRGRLLYTCALTEVNAHTASNLSSQTSGTACLFFSTAVSYFRCRVIHRLRFNANWGGGNAINAFTDRAKKEKKNGKNRFECIAKMSKTPAQRRRFGKETYEGLSFCLYSCLFVWHAVSPNTQCTHADNSV